MFQISNICLLEEDKYSRQQQTAIAAFIIDKGSRVILLFDVIIYHNQRKRLA